MTLQLFRIDDRLIHGQVVIGWANYLNSQQIILCDDSVCSNEWERELYLSVVPEQMDAQVLTINQLSELMRTGSDLSRTIIVINSPLVLEKLETLGVAPVEVNVGGIHYKEGREQYLSYLYLSPEEVESFKRLIEHGLILNCQDVPGAKVRPLKSVLLEKKH